VIRTAIAFATAMVVLAVVLGSLLAPFYAGRTVEMFVAGFLAATMLQFVAGVAIWRRLRRWMRDA